MYAQFKTLKTLIAAISFLFCSSIAYAQQPPKGIDWKENLMSGRSEASSRGVPIMMYVADASNSAAAALQDTKVMNMLRHFACVFVSQNYKLQDFQQSYVPWIGQTPQTPFRAPVLIFGDSAGNAKQEYRIEGRAPNADELLQHLERVLKALAPDEAKAASGTGLKTMTPKELCGRISNSLDFLEKKLTTETANPFVEEAKSAQSPLKYLKEKLAKIKDKDKKEEGLKYANEIEKNLKELAKYKGDAKGKEKFEDFLKKAKESLTSLITFIDNLGPDKETVSFKALPRKDDTASSDDLKSELEKLSGVLEVTYEQSSETMKLGDKDVSIAIFKVTFESEKVKKADIEKVLTKLNYDLKWSK